MPHCWKQERPILREVGRLCCSLSTMTTDHDVTECSLYRPEMQLGLWAEVGAQEGGLGVQLRSDL